MELLTYTRIVALAINEMAKQTGLGNMARHFDGDNVSLFTQLGDEVRVYNEQGKMVAVCEVTDNVTAIEPSFDVYICFFDLHDLVRSEHLGEFEPHLYGLYVNRARNWLGEKEPDLVAEWTVDINQVRKGPARPLPQYQVPISRVKGIASVG